MSLPGLFAPVALKKKVFDFSSTKYVGTSGNKDVNTKTSWDTASGGRTFAIGRPVGGAPATEAWAFISNYETSLYTEINVNATNYLGGITLYPAKDGAKERIGYSNSVINQNAINYILYSFRERQGFCSSVMWSGNGGNRTIHHNLNAVPVLVIFVSLSNTFLPVVYTLTTGTSTFCRFTKLSAFTATGVTNYFSGTAPDGTNFYVGPSLNVNGESVRAYFFAEVSNKCVAFSYAGTSGPMSVSLPFYTQFAIIKDTSTNNTPWVILDFKNSTHGNLGQAGNNYNTDIVPTATDLSFMSANANYNTNGRSYFGYAIASNLVGKFT